MAWQKPSLQRQSFWRFTSGRSAQAGYGIMMLVLFLTSTVLLGTSIQMVLGGGTAKYVGSLSKDNIAAKDLAQSGMETVLSAIQTSLNAGTVVTTSYNSNC